MKSWAASLLHGRNHDTQTLPSSFPWRHFVLPTLSELDKVSHAAEGHLAAHSLIPLDPSVPWVPHKKVEIFPCCASQLGTPKANLHNSDRQCSSGMKSAQGRTSTRSQEDHRDVSRSRADPASGCSVMLEPGTGHLHPLLHWEDDFAPSGLWQWQLREIHPKGATKYLGFLQAVELSLPL